MVKKSAQQFFTDGGLSQKGCQQPEAAGCRVAIAGPKQTLDTLLTFVVLSKAMSSLLLPYAVTYA